jgi:CheY-like chemotaxis protein
MRGTILVVDDDDDIRDAMMSALEDEGYVVRGASNGRDALVQLPRLEHPCLVLLDLMMPIMSGAELAACMQQDARLAAIPIVIVSAWTRGAERVETAQAQLTKPVDLKRLLDTVDRFCA